MFVEFRFKNKFFEEEQVLSMVALKERMEEENVFKTGVKKIPRLLKSAVIYGANGHGKTLILAMVSSFIEWLGGYSCFMPKKFYSGSYEIVFIYEGEIYCYRVELDEERIVIEELRKNKAGKMTYIFKRSWCENSKKYGIEVGRSFTQLKYLTHLTPGPTHLVMRDLKKSFLTPSLKDKFTFIPSEVETVEFWNLNKEVVKKVERFLKSLDCGIKEVHDSYNGIKFSCESLEGNEVVSPYGLSTGTRWVVNRVEKIFDALEHGKLLVIDDLGNNLHPNLVRHIVELFHKEDTNPKNAQLVFTTHCVNLLSSSLSPYPLRRDQIWFVERCFTRNKTWFYSLSEFTKERNEKKRLEADYQLGCYGAIPWLG